MKGIRPNISTEVLRYLWDHCFCVLAGELVYRDKAQWAHRGISQLVKVPTKEDIHKVKDSDKDHLISRRGDPDRVILN